MEDLEDLDFRIGFSRRCEVNLGASIKLYDAHLILFTNMSYLEWPSKLGEEIKGLTQLQKSKKKFELTSELKVLLHVCEETNSIKFAPYTVFCAVKNACYFITDLREENFDELFQFVSDVKSSSKSLKIEKINIPLFFVCCHTNRDERCGYCGPRIYDKFLEELKKSQDGSDVRVRKIAHTGGHAYAANVLAFPKGDWLGNVNPNDVERIVAFYENNEDNIEKLGDLWRGRMGMSKSEQSKLSPHPKLEKAASLSFSQKKEKAKLEKKKKKREASIRKSPEKIIESIQEPIQVNQPPIIPDAHYRDTSHTDILHEGDLKVQIDNFDLLLLSFISIVLFSFMWI